MKNLSIGLNVLLLIAVIVLYILHFSGNSKSTSNQSGTVTVNADAKIVYINMDTLLNNYTQSRELNEAFLKKTDEYNLDLIVLAGFLVVIPEEMISRYRNKIINIHPSLIPSFCGTGYYGLKVHEAALARGVKVVGATVHFVDEGTDTGPIILQKAVEVEEGDTPEVLQRRVMEQAEWKILPHAIDLIANGKVTVKDGRVSIAR